MRTFHSSRNLITSLSLMVTMILLGFVTRKLFVMEIGVEYLGLNGLLDNILAAVTLLESGFGPSVVYHLYKPLAEGNQQRVLALLQLYRRVYRWIGFVFLIVCLGLYPFLGVFIKDSSQLDYLSLVYFIFVFNSLLPYLTAYKNSLINADQKNYKLAKINFVYQIGLNLSKLGILYYTGNYILYLVVESLFLVGFNVAMVRKVDALYPYIKEKISYVVDLDTKKQIVKNIKALFLHSLGGYFMYATKNVVISSFLGLAVVGLYSNYLLIVKTISSCIVQVVNSVSESSGNLIASAGKEHVYGIFKMIFMINAIICGIASIVLANTISPFVCWWLGPEYALSPSCVWVIILNFYIMGMRRSIMMFKTKAGIFHQDRYSPLLQGLFNLGLSLVLVHWWGLAGVLLAETISVLSIGVWQFPRLVYKHLFHQPLRKYFESYGVYLLLVAVGYGLSYPLCRMTYFSSPLADLFVWGSFSVLIPTVVFAAALYRSAPFRGIVDHVKLLLPR